MATTSRGLKRAGFLVTAMILLVGGCASPDSESRPTTGESHGDDRESSRSPEPDELPASDPSALQGVWDDGQSQHSISEDGGRCTMVPYEHDTCDITDEGDGHFTIVVHQTGGAMTDRLFRIRLIGSDQVGVTLPDMGGAEEVWSLVSRSVRTVAPEPAGVRDLCRWILGSDEVDALATAAKVPAHDRTVDGYPGGGDPRIERALLCMGPGFFVSAARTRTARNATDLADEIREEPPGIKVTGVTFGGVPGRYYGGSDDSDSDLVIGGSGASFLGTSGTYLLQVTFLRVGSYDLPESLMRAAVEQTAERAQVVELPDAS